MPPTRHTATIRLDRELGTVRPELHSHFLEHLGTATYGGLWVGKDSPVPNIDGYRRDAVDALKALEVPVLRWPGGCFADDYHWRDGIGPPPGRPRRVNIWWGMHTEDNSFGTHEFIGLCRLIGARPYLAGNVGSGTVREFRDWMEYCNFPSGSTLADERIANGAREPFRVELWGIGNESWACGGHMTPEEYCALYVRFVTYLRGFGGTEPAFVAVGPDSNNLEWTRRFFDAFRTQRGFHARLHMFAMHYYSWGKSTPLAFTPDTAREQLLTYPALEKAIEQQAALIDGYPRDPRVGPVRLAVDEWGTWNVSDRETEQQHGLYWQQNTIKDGVAAGLALNVFHRQAARLAMCNLAQVMNVLQSPLLSVGDRTILTPTYHVLMICKEHRGKTAVATEHDDQSPLGLSLSASRGDRTLVVTLVNPLHDVAKSVRCAISGGAVTAADCRIVHHPDLNGWNSPDAPARIVPREHGVSVSGDALAVELPPMAVATVRGTLK